jgi:NAD(P)-dependent dehydrogenase (short-subunit alcohol dehydrogenase family)
MPQPIANQSVLVFGGSSGIGAALCERLVAADAKVWAAARGEERLNELSARLDLRTSVVDVLDPAQVEATMDAAIEAFGGLDAVVLSVGSILLRPAHRLKDQDFVDTLAINLHSAMYVVRAAAKRMMRSGGGSVLLFSTAAAQVGFANHEAIAAAKAGVEGLARAAAATYAARGLRVNCIAPGLIRTPLSKGITSHQATLKASQDMHALGRIGEPDDIAHAAQFLLESTWITGQTLVVDGGLAGIAR